MASVTIGAGRIIVYRVFDVAEEVDLAAVERLLKTTQGASRLSIARSTGHALVFRNAPLTLKLQTADVRLGQQRRPAEVFARVWDYGVISIQFHLPIASGTSWHDLLGLEAMAEDEYDYEQVASVRSR